MKGYKAEYEKIMEDGLKQIEIGKRMVAYAKECLDKDTEDMEEDDKDDEYGEEEDDDEEKSSASPKAAILLAIGKSKK